MSRGLNDRWIMNIRFSIHRKQNNSIGRGGYDEFIEL